MFDKTKIKNKSFKTNYINIEDYWNEFYTLKIEIGHPTISVLSLTINYNPNLTITTNFNPQIDNTQPININKWPTLLTKEIEKIKYDYQLIRKEILKQNKNPELKELLPKDLIEKGDLKCTK